MNEAKLIYENKTRQEIQFIGKEDPCASFRVYQVQIDQLSAVFRNQESCPPNGRRHSWLPVQQGGME
jgi:hypothetical protein